jgi:DNA-directed RNA polymerase subunit M/transcription elongation factor TFIIS
MNTLDSPGELLRLSEHYRRMTDEELIELGLDSSELTDMARQALAMEISQRRLKVPRADETRDEPASEDQGSAEYDAYDPERGLIDVRTVWSLPDALEMQRLLDNAGIPFVMGAEKATRAEAVTSNFSDGVSVQVMKAAGPWITQAIQYYQPQSEPPEYYKDSSDEGLAIRCPKCHSTEVIFDELDGDDKSPQKFKWTCESCGHEWEDEGVETEK